MLAALLTETSFIWLIIAVTVTLIATMLFVTLAVEAEVITLGRSARRLRNAKNDAEAADYALRAARTRKEEDELRLRTVGRELALRKAYESDADPSEILGLLKGEALKTSPF